MTTKLRIVLIITFVTLFFSSCKRGCKEEKACNYDSKAKLKGTCSYDPDNVKTARMPRGGAGLNLTTGAITYLGLNYVREKGLLYFKIHPSEYTKTILHLEGSESVSDLGQVKGLCEVTDKSGPYGSPNVKEESHGYIVYLDSTKTYARVYVVEIVQTRYEDYVSIKYEYPF